MKYLAILLICCLFSCKPQPPTYNLEALKTDYLDSSYYTLIEKEFPQTSIGTASEYLGGLTPSYPIESIFLFADSNCSPGWQNDGMMAGCRVYFIEKQGRLEKISSVQQLREHYAPIESTNEALSFAIAASKDFPIFDESFFKDEFHYYNSKPKTTRVIKQENGYLVILYDYKTFGCGGHPYFMVSYLVTEDGQISEEKRQKAFIDPEDTTCRD